MYLFKGPRGIFRTLQHMMASSKCKRFKPLTNTSQNQTQEFIAPVPLGSNFRDLCQAPYQSRHTSDQNVQDNEALSEAHAAKCPAYRKKGIPPLALGGHLGLVKDNQIPMAPNIGGWRCYVQAADSGDRGGPVKESGGRLGKLDAATESGFFHKMNKARLEKLKKILEQQAMLKGDPSDQPKDKPMS